jgi:hypothetical protein
MEERGWKSFPASCGSYLIRKRDHPIRTGFHKLWPAHDPDEMFLGAIISSLCLWWKTATWEFSHLQVEAHALAASPFARTGLIGAGTGDPIRF